MVAELLKPNGLAALREGIITLRDFEPGERAGFLKSAGIYTYDNQHLFGIVVLEEYLKDDSLNAIRTRRNTLKR